MLRTKQVLRRLLLPSSSFRSPYDEIASISCERAAGASTDGAGEPPSRTCDDGRRATGGVRAAGTGAACARECDCVCNEFV